jgi:hypothetical protein
MRHTKAAKEKVERRKERASYTGRGYKGKDSPDRSRKGKGAYQSKGPKGKGSWYDRSGATIEEEVMTAEAPIWGW